MLQLGIQIKFDDESWLESGKVTLLEGIAKGGSISAAGRLMDMSCTRAWKQVAEINRTFDESLMMAEIGGRSGGRSVLTERGQDLIRHYRAIEREARSATAAHRKAMQALFRESNRS